MYVVMKVLNEKKRGTKCAGINICDHENGTKCAGLKLVQH
ncbi:hypothetical protein F383_19494 [Gossypium arboreum]|uniref:Uncharacterized protein n=1 Tax=Gossypium arboreum TaxID=29729 RepID=A0A0B0NKK1_GOSAR|nr:hypothetical protein F383_19494 [Gossypium arboreum]